MAPRGRYDEPQEGNPAPRSRQPDAAAERYNEPVRKASNRSDFSPSDGTRADPTWSDSSWADSNRAPSERSVSNLSEPAWSEASRPEDSRRLEERPDPRRAEAAPRDLPLQPRIPSRRSPLQEPLDVESEPFDDADVLAPPPRGEGRSAPIDDPW
jgi:hypothetical protein